MLTQQVSLTNNWPFAFIFSSPNLYHSPILFLLYSFSVVVPSCIDVHLRQIDPRHVHQVPAVSPLQPLDIQRFAANHLQPGLFNDGNCCCLLSVVLCLHRVGIIKFLNVPNRMNRNRGSSHYASGVLAKILLALPSSGAFSIQGLIITWNQSGLNLQLGQNEDIFIVEGIMKNLSFNPHGLVPALTQYKAQYYCQQCQIQYTGISDNQNARFEVIPSLDIPDQQVPINPADLMTTLMNERFQLTCQTCQSQINDATYDIVKGKITIITLGRLHYQNGRPVKKMTPLNCGPSSSQGAQFLGELVAVMCHSPGHWTSYSKTDTGWFHNDDDRAVVPSSPFSNNVPGETIDMLCYINP